MADFSEFKEFDGLRLRLASSAVMRSWSRGEVREPETINYRTFRPEKDGLFCEKIFGPTRDYECYCGKYRKVRFKGVICDKCGVEVTRKIVRRERMGHIELSSPCAHVWFFGTVPSKMARLLGVRLGDLKAVIYYSRYLISEISPKDKEKVIAGLAKESEVAQKELATTAEEGVQEALKLSEKEAKKLDAGKKREKTLLVGRKEAARLRDTLVVDQSNLERKYEILEKHITAAEPLSIVGELEYSRLQPYFEKFAKVGTGAETVKAVLEGLDIEALSQQLREELSQTKSKGKKLQLVSRLKVVDQFCRSGVKPEWMILDVLPVIPPELRPMVQLEGGRFATSDLNDLYRVIINRNNRLKNLLELGAPEVILRNEKRMLQEAVDALIDSRRAEHRRRGQKTLRSLSDLIRGKQGRFRRNLLGKRVDYSGRSVIVVGPELKLYECGLPKEMALELFKPMVIREILLEGLASNVRTAKDFLEMRSAEVWDLLERVVANHPVLLNRAPTLHRLGILAFYPKLSEGSAIKLHPCVCAGYNADFDGDQMAVHVPLSKKAIAEASELMLSSKNLLKPSSGAPVVSPSKDMVLGLYWLTKEEHEGSGPANGGPFDLVEATLAWDQGALGLRKMTTIEVGGKLRETTLGRVFFNEVLPESLRFVNQSVGSREVRVLVERCLEDAGEERTVQLVDDLKDLGFRFATISGISAGIFDVRSVSGKDAEVAKAEASVADVEQNFARGLITDGERKRLSQEIWLDATNTLAARAWEEMDSENPMRMMVESGSRGSQDQVKQMVGMKGLVVDPTGTVVELPTKSNYFEGLSEFEYFVGTRGSRKGLTDTALRTADAGYLTRRLVDVAQEVLVREENCGTASGWEIRGDEGEEFASLSERIFGRAVAKTVKDAEGKILARRNEIITKGKAQDIEAAGVGSVWVRSPLTCQSRWGICQKCYGVDIGGRGLVKIGTPVGVIAAESIGEPGTQLTLRTFHTGGIVGQDITQGLPRVEQLVEARVPKVLAGMTGISGKVSLKETSEGTTVTITGAEGETEEHLLPKTVEVLLTPGQLVPAGYPLSSGYLDPKEILEAFGVQSAQRYVLSEIQKVYSSQGVNLNDKHIEVVLRQMCSKLRVKSSGDTSFLPGEIVSKDKFLAANEAVVEQGGAKAKAKPLILGVTRASLNADSWLAAASFQETTRILTDAAVENAYDPLRGLKENVIVGRRVPVGAIMDSPPPAVETGAKQ